MERLFKSLVTRAFSMGGRTGQIEEEEEEEEEKEEEEEGVEDIEYSLEGVE